MTTEQDVNAESADAGAQTDQAQAAAGAMSFSAEQQSYIDKLVGERLKRAQEKWMADLEAKGEAEKKSAEAKRLKDEQKWQELAQAQEVKAAEAEGKLATAQEQLERANKLVEGLVESRKKGLPEAMLKALDGRDIYDQLEIANAFLEAMPTQPPSGAVPQRQAATTPTPAAQGNRELTPDERRQKAARIW